jgi:hypothetical protein
MTLPCEHFVTLFDASFLPMGLALYESLAVHAGRFQLWVVCMDEEVERHLTRLALPHLSPIPLHDIETADLKAVKPQRSVAEYCWTITPFSHEAVLEREPRATRVTYVDADLFFFDDPAILLSELDQSGRHVLVTEHAYAPEYDFTETSGRFCVQFLTFDRSAPAARVMHWWQDRCLECCSATPVNGKFGDQKYLEQWPELFGGDVHIVAQVEKTLAPWNVRHFARQTQGPLKPVFYHFHLFRLLPGRRARLYCDYRLGAKARRLYAVYVREVSRAWRRLEAMGISTPARNLPYPDTLYHRLKRRLLARERVERL